MESWQERVPVLGRWEPQQRRKASLGATIAAIVLLLLAVAAVFIGTGSQVGTFLLVILVLLVLMFVFQALVVVTGLRSGDAEAGAQEGGGAAWQESYSPPSEQTPGAPAGDAQLTLKCSSCGTVFDIADTGERPLRHSCPGCGATGELTEADLGPAPAAGPAITLKCGSCGTVFDVTDTGERPLHHVCPGCGSEGVLREEDLAPAPVEHAIAEATEPSLGPGGPAPEAVIAALSAGERRQPIEATEGIGPTYGSKLREAGAANLEQFLRRDPDVLANQTGLRVGLVRKWHAQGQLQAIDGVGPQYSELLLRAGIGSLAQLAEQSPERLAGQLNDYQDGLGQRVEGNRVSPSQVTPWIRQAKSLTASAAPVPSVRVKNLKLRCKNCSTVFTLRDTGDRPLYHECPGCKATGVLR